MADGLTVFDRFAELMNSIVSRAPFFLFCVLMVVVWIPSILVIQSIDTWQLIINTATTIVTFLMVSLDANTSRREDRATQAKLDALLDLMGQVHDTDTKQALDAQGMEKEISS